MPTQPHSPLQAKHRKFQDGEWADMQTALQRDPARPAYKLGIRYEAPGIFYLGFVLRNTPQRENFSVLPNGFYFRKKVSSVGGAVWLSLLGLVHELMNNYSTYEFMYIAFSRLPK